MFMKRWTEYAPSHRVWGSERDALLIESALLLHKQSVQLPDALGQL